MVDQDSVRVKAYTKKELKILYSVSYQTINKWLKKHEVYIGKPEGYIYTPEQVKRIFERFGEP